MSRKSVRVSRGETSVEAESGSAASGRLTRRSFLGQAGAAGAAVAAPFYVRNVHASSGELNILIWSDELPQALVAAFTAETGIRVNTTPIASNEEQANKLQASFGEGYDLCMPSVQRPIEYKALEVLAPFDTNRIKMDALLPSQLKPSVDMWTWDRRLYHVPHVWGSEGLSWRTDAINLTYETASYGLAWDPQYAHKVLMRPVSGLLTLGLWLDATGKLPTNRMLDTYKDERTMRKIYDEILKFAVARKSQVKQFWSNADAVRTGFLKDGCVIGVTWDGPVLSMVRAGQPVRYIAPREGAIAWTDGFSLLKRAKNVDQAYALIDFMLKPKNAAQLAKLSGYNPVVKGADALMPQQDAKLFADVYPGDALDRLWRYPSAPSWFNAARNEYAEKFKVA